MTNEEIIEKFESDKAKASLGIAGGVFVQTDLVHEIVKALRSQPCEDKIIEWKKDFKEYVNSLSMPRDDYKGIMEYIDELPVTSEPCEDAISREEAIGAVADLFEMSEYPHPYPQGKPIRLREIKEKLKQLPPVQPKPKTGHWIFDEMLDRNYYCSECKSMGVDYWDYCPYCGCRMVEPQESEDKE